MIISWKFSQEKGFSPTAQSFAALLRFRGEVLIFKSFLWLKLCWNSPLQGSGAGDEQVLSRGVGSRMRSQAVTLIPIFPPVIPAVLGMCHCSGSSQKGTQTFPVPMGCWGVVCGVEGWAGAQLQASIPLILAALARNVGFIFIPIFGN